jgi:hypothetical protein
MADDKQPQQLTFNGETYSVEDLTPRAIEGFNLLINVQQKLNNLSTEVRVLQASQVGLEIEFTKIIEEDAIQPLVIEAKAEKESTKDKKVN